MLKTLLATAALLAVTMVDETLHHGTNATPTAATTEASPAPATHYD